MSRKIALSLLLLLLAGLMGGCWDRRELNELAIVLGAGVDWVEDGRLRLTVQIARPAAFAGGGEAGAREAPASWVVSAEGRTVEEAERYLAMKVPRDIYWGHGIILVYGEEMARRGVGMASNFFKRKAEPRDTMWVMVAKGEAREFLETYSDLTKASAQAMGLLTRMKTGCSVQLREFAEMLASKGIQPTATLVEVKEAGVTPGPGLENISPAHRQVEIAGTAVFREDRMIGWLDAHETRGLLWLKGEAVQGAITVPSPGEPDKQVSIRIQDGKTKVIPEYDGKNLRFKVMLRVEGELVEQQSRENLAKPEMIEALEVEMAGVIRERAEVALKKARDEYGVDIFGFGDAFHRRYKKEWRGLKDRWDEEFARAEVDIAVEARIRK
ncbi:MAG: Ger(x)C family spore germination protein, partial [Syntrophomonadaceae bacterium]|nr:Ger(x)C family spore germination protein [Syntrophomonadaceae bacterium]